MKNQIRQKSTNSRSKTYSIELRKRLKTVIASFPKYNEIKVVNDKWMMRESKG